MKTVQNYLEHSTFINNRKNTEILVPIHLSPDLDYAYQHVESVVNDDRI